MKKKILSIICLIVYLFTITNINVKGYSETGHEDFKKIKFVGEGTLLKDFKEAELEEEIRRLPRNFIGWKTRTLTKSAKAKYDGKVIFARSNQSNATMTIEYIMKETETTETSVVIKGSVSTKITGTIKKINTTVGGEIGGEAKKEDVNTYATESKTTLNIVIKPNTKIVLIVTGVAYITNGVSKFRFFGITMRKGAWERIEVDTIVFELREEKA